VKDIIRLNLPPIDKLLFKKTKNLIKRKINMDTINLTFGTKGNVNFCISTIQNNYDRSNLLPIVVEENGPESYLVNIFDSDHCESVFPVFKTVSNPYSYFKFSHGDNERGWKQSQVIRVAPNKCISSFPIGSTVYGLEILNENKEKRFEEHGGHHLKSFTVEFGVDEMNSYDGCRVETDSCCLETDGYCQSKKIATVALNNSSTERYTTAYFDEPDFMGKRTFNFHFKNNLKMMDTLYL
jgi:hypothetical protein